MNSPATRGRFAPSPSGPLHFGSLVAALGSFLCARSSNSEWLLRIDDLDPPRVVRGAADAILRALDQLGLHWDGTEVYQSQRLELYAAARQRLTDIGLTYRCSCTRKAIRATAAFGPCGPIYPGICRDGIADPDRQTTLRVRCPNGDIQLTDKLQGEYRQNLAANVGDFIVQRADQVFAYQLAVVVDDAEQGITDVVRGCDLLSSTPQQLWLQQSLGLARPVYVHLPVVLQNDGSKLSKQAGAQAVDCASPGQALRRALHFLGHEPPEHLCPEPVEELLRWAVESWQLKNVPPDNRVVNWR